MVHGLLHQGTVNNGSRRGGRRVTKKQRGGVRIARSNWLDMVLNKVDDIIIKLFHMCKLRHEHVVASPQSLVILRQSGEGSVVAAGETTDGTSCWGREGWGVAPVGLVVGVGGRDANSAGEREESWAIDMREWRRMGMVMVVVVIYGYLRLCCFPSVDLTQQMLLSLLEELVCKLPSVRYNLPKTIGVKLTNKAGEVVVLEVVG